MSTLLPKFAALGLSESTLLALQKKGFEEPSPIQAQVIPTLLHEQLDIIGQAQTGTGKTAAFGLPLIEKLQAKGEVQALILAPTRELAIQVSEELHSFVGNKGLQVVPIYGGQSMVEQLRRLKKGVDIVVGTPGRVMDHIERKSLKLDKVQYVVLDEADEMLNMGFLEDVESILSKISHKKRMLLFSATMPGPLMKIADKYMGEKKVVAVKANQLTTQLTHQIYFEVREADKLEALCRIIDIEDSFYGVIFCRTKVDVDTVTHALLDRGYAADGLHGDISQDMREKILNKFRKQNINILVATDVAARGIDIQNLSHVINYALPQNPESYVHRIGRTGRAGKQGTAITFITPNEYRKLSFIQKITKTEIKKQKLPGVQQIIDKKWAKIQQNIEQALQNEPGTDYQNLAGSLLKEHSATQVLAAVLKFAFQGELDEKSYRNIQETRETREAKEGSVDSKGTAKLFVGQGKAQGLTPSRLVELIKKVAKTKEHKIQNIEIMDKCSFITVPFSEAEFILRAFKRISGGKKSMIEKAKA
ncbi:MAG: helicase, superfamily [Gammaproteobacteria bacterium]|jgi:ATP-dependent RNA helicase DeaD|nr:helicase, superfamily [Gammaproteobacteria bacterium]